MKFLKMIIQKIVSFGGYELRKIATTTVSFENFVNLAQAYEKLFGEANTLLPENEIRTRLLARLSGTLPTEVYFIIQALVQVREVNGDVCEFGVAQGQTSTLIANEIALSGSKILHLFDSFEGLPKPSEKDQLKDDILSLGSMKAYTGTMSYPEDIVRARLKAISFPPQRYFIHKGFIEQLLPKDRNLPKEVCFAYVDFDFYEPIKLALEFLHEITPCGAIIIVDDYDFFSTGSKAAVDEFLQEKNSNEMLYECFVPNTRYGYFAVLTKKS